MANKRTYKFGCSQLSIEFGDLTTSTAQVLVSSDDSYLSMGGGVSASILRAGGQAIAMDAAKKVPAALGDVIVTSAGSLPAHYIFHAVTIGLRNSNKTPKEIIKQTTGRCMQILDALRLNSIAFPAIGAGLAGFRYEDVAVIMAEVISKDLLERQTPMEVTLYLLDRFGEMKEMDFIRFFEEFAVRAPRFADHEAVDTTEFTILASQPVIDVGETNEQVKKRDLTNLRKLIGLLGDIRSELEIRIIDSEKEEEKTKLRRMLDENQESRLELLNALQGISQEGTSSESKKEPKAKIISSEKIETLTIETYQDFDLYIASTGHVIASSLQGEAVSDISPEPPEDIQLALKLIEQGQTSEGLLKQVGQSLYSWLFPSAIHTQLQVTEAVARNNKAKLRLRLRIEANTIASLPLEFLYRTIGGYYLAVNPDTVLSRYLNIPHPSERIFHRENPLHMLVILSEPSDQGKFYPDQWEEMFRNALSRQIESGALTFDTVKQATRKEISKALLQKKPDIIQFVGHGIYKDGVGYIALVDENTGKTRMVNDESFANLFMGSDDHLGLVSLTACESAESENLQGFSGVALQLVERGMPAVIAMQYTVQIESAKIFFESFYTSLAYRKPVDWAVQYARNAVSQELGLKNREFATPVLYMRAKDGNVF